MERERGGKEETARKRGDRREDEAGTGRRTEEESRGREVQHVTALWKQIL